MTNSDPTTGYKLVSENDNDVELQIGFIYRDFRNEEHELLGFTPPNHAGSTGRVRLRDGDGYTGEFFPGVIGARIVRVDDVADADADADADDVVATYVCASCEKKSFYAYDDASAADLCAKCYCEACYGTSADADADAAPTRDVGDRRIEGLRRNACGTLTSAVDAINNLASDLTNHAGYARELVGPDEIGTPFTLQDLPSALIASCLRERARDVVTAANRIADLLREAAAELDAADTVRVTAADFRAERGTR